MPAVHPGGRIDDQGARFLAAVRERLIYRIFQRHVLGAAAGPISNHEFGLEQIRV